MGVLNVTPDSFSDGGRFNTLDRAVAQARSMMAAGAQYIDVGGESTRPGAAPVSESEELDRVLPVIQAMADWPVVVSIDTRHAAVMQAAVACGARMINDVNALRGPNALAVAAQCQVPVCLMHMQGEPGTMQAQPRYEDVVDEVCRFLLQRVEAATTAGIAEAHIVLDPGFGFGKTLAHNVALFKSLDRIVALGFPVLAGVSRKSMLGALLDQADPAQRLSGGLAAASLAVASGVRIVRTHDVAQTVDAVRISAALSG